jgi:UDP-glucose 4-epimerase
MAAAETVVLGGTGFLGRALCRALQVRGIETVPVGSAALDLTAPDADSGIADMLNGGATLVLAAAITPPRAETPAGAGENRAIVTAVAGALARHAPRRCVYVSSDAVYAWSPEPLVEASALDPRGLYGSEKAAAEAILAEACDAAGVPLLVLRPTGVFGPGDPHGAYGPNRFVRDALADGSVTLFGDGSERRDHLYVEDFGSFAAALVDSAQEGVVNVASGTSTTFAQIVDELGTLLASSLRVLHEPRAIPITHRSFDVSRLRRTVPGAVPTPLVAALAATVAEERAAGAS